MSGATLRKAAAIVRERGLSKTRHEDDQHRVSAIGALRVVHVGSGWVAAVIAGEFGRDYEATRRLLPKTPLGLPPGNLVVWSNNPERTAEDVAAAFEAAAARLDAS